MFKESVAVAILAAALPVQAGVYKCEAANGRLSFSDKPCPEDRAQLDYRLTTDDKERIRREEEQRQWEENRRLNAASAAEKEKQRQRELLDESIRLSEELKRWTKVSGYQSHPVYNSGWDSSVQQVEQYLQRTLKDPDSYEAISWGPVWTKSGEEYRVRAKYRAKNSFGGYVIENQVFILDAGGQITRVTEYNGKSVIFH